MIDAFGRAVTVSGSTYSVPGIAITADNDATALATLNSMAPPGWSPPRDAENTIQALAFIERFTPAEQTTLMAANPLWGVQIAAAGIIDVTNAQLVTEMQAAVAQGALTQARMDQVRNLALASP